MEMMMERLPDDLLADVLGRLPASSLAASRCVRRHWCSIIDGRRLLRADLLPLRLDGIYCISFDIIEQFTYLFARPSAAVRRIPGGCLDFLEHYIDLQVEDHCNGLLLVCDMVVNPATRQWANLPICPEPLSIDDMLMLELGGVRVWKGMTDQEQDHDLDQGHDQDLDQEEEQENDYNYNDGHHEQRTFLSSRFYLVYDPMAESPQHFEVFLVPLLLRRDLLDNRENINIDLEEQEWPPSTFRTHVFSSRRWRWEERSLLRQGEPAGTMADMLRYDDCWERKAVYFRGVLYVHCQDDSVMRIDVSNDKYQMMRSPANRTQLGAERATFYLGKSEKGVYSALLYWADWDSYPQFRVWLLKEKVNNSHHTVDMEWALKTEISLEPLLALAIPDPLHGIADNEWRIIRNYNDKDIPPTVAAAAHKDDEFAADDEWDFDNGHEIVLEDNKGHADRNYPVDFLGFHPYKEIVFFSLSSRTLSYNFSTSKVQELGDKAHIPVGIRTSFPYTSCLLTMGDFFENN